MCLQAEVLEGAVRRAAAAEEADAATAEVRERVGALKLLVYEALSY